MGSGSPVPSAPVPWVPGVTGPAPGSRYRMAPCSFSSISGGSPSSRSIRSAARGSVARASRFSSSVSAIVRSVRISSISVASNRSPALSGAISGWSYRMTGEDSTRSWQSAGPASTGQVPTFVHAATSAAAHSGWSVMEMNDPPGMPISVCAVTRA